MAGETFYTYLGGPRTFWGNSGSNIRINNNFCLPTCTPPLMIGGCGCGYNNLRMNSPLSIMAMVNNMMAQTLPYWNFNYTGNTGMTSSGGENTSLDKLTSARQSLNSFGFTKAEGYGLYLDEDNNVVYSYSKDGKEYTASSLAELTSKISGRSSEGAGNSGATDSTIVASGTAGSSETTGTAEASETDAASAATDDTSEVDSAATTSSSRTRGNKRKFSRDDVGKNFEWTTYRKLSDPTLKQKIAGCRTTVDLMKTLFPDWFVGNNKTDEQIKGSKYYKALMNANPTAIDNDGNIVNKHKLDIIVKKGSNTQATDTRNSPHTIKARNGYSLERKADGTYAYTKNGQPVSVQDYAKACPQTFINEHNKRWTADTILAALTAFDSIKLANYPNSGKGCIKSVIATTASDKSRIGIIANYKGNGVLNNWKYTMTYTKLKNGVIGLDINKIYEDVMQGYNKIGS